MTYSKFENNFKIICKSFRKFANFAHNFHKFSTIFLRITFKPQINVNYFHTFITI